MPAHPERANADRMSAHLQAEEAKGAAKDEIRRSVQKALVRMDQGEYGLCESCGKEIPKVRLDALPYAVLCVDCQHRREQEGFPGTVF